MASPYGFMGGMVDRDTRETSGLVRGGNNWNSVVLRQDFVVDPSLPRLADHPITKEAIVIPKGKIVTVSTTKLTNTPATISICNATAIPAGVAVDAYFRQSYYGMERPVPAPTRDQQITMPFISATNDAGGTLVNGDLLASDASGNFVKWDGTTVNRIVGRVDVIDTRGGNTPGWLKWVTTNFSDWAYGLMFDQNTTATVTRDGATNTASTGATPVTISFNGAVVTCGTTPASSLYANSDNTIYYLAKDRLNLTVRPLDVIVGGVTQSKDSAYGGYNWGDGYGYMVDPVLGFIRFTTAIGTTVTVQATYAYEADYVSGLSYGQGIPGLTDGQVSGIGPGIQAWFDQVGATGKMLITLRSF